MISVIALALFSTAATDNQRAFFPGQLYFKKTLLALPSLTPALSLSPQDLPANIPHLKQMSMHVQKAAPRCELCQWIRMALLDPSPK